MLRTIAIVAAAAVPLFWAAPAAAQNASVNGVRTIYGEDRCPEGEICVVAPESERYRIPKNLREEQEIARENQSWALRQQGALEAGASGTGSCSTTGAGGGTGCYKQQVGTWKAEQKAKKEAETDLPLP